MFHNTAYPSLGCLWIWIGRRCWQLLQAELREPSGRQLVSLCLHGTCSPLPWIQIGRGSVNRCINSIPQPRKWSTCHFGTKKSTGTPTECHFLHSCLHLSLPKLPSLQEESGCHRCVQVSWKYGFRWFWGPVVHPEQVVTTHHWPFQSCMLSTIQQ